MTQLYQLTSSQSVIRIADGASIPFAPGNADYQIYLAWVAEGNTPDPAPVPSLTIAVDNFLGARLTAGFADTGQGGTGKTYACDSASIGIWTAIAASAQPFALGIAPNGLTPPTYQPVPTDNTIPSPMSAGAVYALFEGRVMPWVSATILFGRVMKNNILADNPPADITQGWP